MFFGHTTTEEIADLDAMNDRIKAVDFSHMPDADDFDNGSLVPTLRAGVSGLATPTQLIAFFAQAFTAVAKLRGDVTNKVFAGGADPTGTLDSTAAFQAAIAFLAGTGGELYMPAGIYRLDHQLTFPGPPGNTNPQGQNGPMISVRGEGMYASVIDATRNTSTACFDMSSVGGSNSGWYMRDFSIMGPKAEEAGQNSRGIWFSGTICLVQSVFIYGFNFGFWAYFTSQIVFYQCHAREARTYNCYISGRPDSTIGITVHNSLFQVANPAGNSFSEAANVAIDGASNVLVSGCLVDETAVGAFGAASLLILSGKDIEIHRTKVFVPYGIISTRIGVHVCDGSTASGGVTQRVKISSMRVESYALDRVPTNTIKIDSGALDVTLEDISTDPNGGGDISDSGTRSRWRNVNGVSKNDSFQLIGEQDINYAANITINPALGDVVFVNLTGNLHYNAPTAPVRGQRLRVMMQQDATGGRTVSWDAAFAHVAWSDTGNTASTISSIEFIYGASGVWLQSGAQKGWS